LNLHRLLSPFLLTLGLLLSACSPQDTGNASAPARREIAVATVAAQAKGFAVGSLMSANTVYVFFDTQCPHCAHLWEASRALHGKIKFVWIPVGMINAISSAQAAALLTALDPGTLMGDHEASLLAGKGGISGSSSVPADIEKAIKSNTQLLNSFGAEAVPFVVAKNLKTGQTVSRDGAMSTQVLAEFLGLDLP